MRGEPIEAPEEASAQNQDERDDIQDPDVATQHTSGLGALSLGLGGFADDGPGSSGRCASPAGGLSGTWSCEAEQAAAGVSSGCASQASKHRL